MNLIPENVDFNYDLAKIWLAQQNLADYTPEQIKEMFLTKLRQLKDANVERWD